MRMIGGIGVDATPMEGVPKFDAVFWKRAGYAENM
jgi:hypothetical protein